MSARESASGTVFSNRAAVLRHPPHHQRQLSHPPRPSEGQVFPRISSPHGSTGAMMGLTSIGQPDDVRQPAQGGGDGGVVMRRRVIDLDKNRIKCNRNRIWPRPSSFLSFFKQSLGSSSGTSAGESVAGTPPTPRPPVSNGVPNGSEPVVEPRGDSKRATAQQLDLNMIRKLEEEIYKRGREQRPDAEARDFHEFYFNHSRRHSGAERKTFASETSAFNGDNHRAVLLVDSNALEPILLKRPLSTEEAALLQERKHHEMNRPAKEQSNGRPVDGGGSGVGGGGNKSIIIVDNSEFYPVLMRYDINSEEIERQAHQQQQYRRTRNEKLKIDTSGGNSATGGQCQPSSSTSSTSSSSVAFSTVATPPIATSSSAGGFPMKADEKLSSTTSSLSGATTSPSPSPSIAHPDNGGGTYVSNVPKSRPPTSCTSGDRSGGQKAKQNPPQSRTANLFQRFLQQRRSLNLSVRRTKRGRPPHECPHFKGGGVVPTPDAPFRRPVWGDIILARSTNGSISSGQSQKLPSVAGSNKVKFEYLKRMARYDCEVGRIYNSRGRRSFPTAGRLRRRAASEPDLVSRQNWKSDSFVQHLHARPHRRTLYWSTGDLGSLGRMMKQGRNFENIFDSTSDNLSARLSAVGPTCSSSSSSVPLCGSGSLSGSSTTTGSSQGSTTSGSQQRALQRRLVAALVRQSHSKPPPSGSTSAAYSGSGSNSSMSLATSGTPTTNSGGNILRKKSSSFRGVLRRSNTPDVVNTWVYRKR